MSSKTRLTNADKASDPDNYILNPKTKQYVKITSPIGKLILKGEQPLKESDLILIVVTKIKEHCHIDADDIKNALIEIQQYLPKTFPIEFGGKGLLTKIKTNVKPKHPDAPKRNTNAFILFSNNKRPDIKSKNKDSDNKEISKILGDIWSNLDDSDPEKKKFVEEANNDKIRYDKEMEEFKNKHPEISNISKKPTKTTGYQIYRSSVQVKIKDENPDEDHKEIMRIIGQSWTEMDDDEKQEFNDKAKVENEDYESRLDEYLKTSTIPKKLSAIEKEKAKNTEEFELNTNTGRYVKKKNKVIKSASKTASITKSDSGTDEISKISKRPRKRLVAKKSLKSLNKSVSEYNSSDDSSDSENEVESFI